MSPFTWLPLSDRKTLPSIKVVYRDIDYAAGLFYPKHTCKWIDHDLDMDRGESDIIVLSTRWGDPTESTISHEHRHFQQHYFLGLPQIGILVPFENDGTHEGWKAGIKAYYQKQPWEMDALLYSERVIRNDSNDEQMEAVFQ